MEPEVVRGYLVLTVEEASGKTQKDQFTWDTNIGSAFEAFVKVEVRGGPRNVKAQTRKAALIGETITWREELKLELLEGATELRMMLCREKFLGTKKGTSVIAACGIFVNDILDAVPIDKYFELFKPNAGGEGGYIRIAMDYVKAAPNAQRAELPQRSSQPSADAEPGTTSATQLRGIETLAGAAKRADQAANAASGAGQGKGAARKKKGGRTALTVLAVMVAAGGAAAGIILGRKRA